MKDVVILGARATKSVVAKFVADHPEYTAVEFAEGERAVLSADPAKKEKPPGLLRKAANLAGAAVAHAASGLKHVGEEAYAKRLEACATCPHLTDKRCSLCGCPVEKKAKWESSTCPDKPSRWSLL